ncbi:MAG: restriction endonuclease subunit S [Sulfuricaulis sp.]
MTGTDFRNRAIDWNSCYRITEERFEEDPYIHLREGDILVTKDGTIGKLAQVGGIPGKASVNSGIFVTRQLAGIDYDCDFMYYLLSSTVFNGFIDYEKTGTTINHLYQEIFENFEYCYPPSVSEQRLIAIFLNRETVRIDALINKKQWLIELLDEKCTALISQVVTKGLNPDAHMKDSCVEWLGEIPAHWRVTKIKFSAKVFNGSTPSRINPEYWDEGTVPWLSSGKANEDIVSEPSELITEIALQKSSLQIAPKGSVIIGIVGQGKTRGLSAFLKIDTTINQNLAAIVPSAYLNGRFLHFVLQHLYEPIRELGRGANQPALDCDLVRQILIPMPEKAEQDAIVEYLEASLNLYTKIANRVLSVVEQLSEYRAALISAAVTGKIDVRGLAREREVA